MGLLWLLLWTPAAETSQLRYLSPFGNLSPKKYLFHPKILQIVHYEQRLAGTDAMIFKMCRKIAFFYPNYCKFLQKFDQNIGC
jgi:hypothetical protein